jgi:hypothetical protein
LRENLRPSIINQGGIDVFLAVLKSENPLFTKVEAMRMAAKGLVNLVAHKRDLRLRALTDLAE